MNHEPTFNAQLNTWRQAVPSADAGKGHIEAPGKGVNLRWQNRATEPSAYENALAAAIEAAYLQGARTPAAMVASFNAVHFHTQSGNDWTPGILESEMQRLGH